MARITPSGDVVQALKEGRPKPGPKLVNSTLRAWSPKTEREMPDRTTVRVETFELAGGHCQAQGLLRHRCSRMFEVHEVIPRGRKPGSHLDLTLTVLLCTTAHRLVTRDKDGEASAVGLLFKAGEEELAREAVASLRTRKASDG